MGSAILSPCTNYRYLLSRDLVDPILGGKTYAFVGVNPSTADASIDDHTVRKWIGFVERWGGAALIVANVFAYRATDVRELAKVADPIGRDNDFYLRYLAARADVIVPCWGNRSKVPAALRRQFDVTERLLLGLDKPVMAFGYTESGDPLHPLTLGYSTSLVAFKSRTAP